MSYLNGGASSCANNARLHREKGEAGILDGIRRIFPDSAVIEEGKRRARALIARTPKRSDSRASRVRTVREEIANHTDAIAPGRAALRAGDCGEAPRGRRRASEPGGTADPADRRHRAINPATGGGDPLPSKPLPKTLAAGSVELAREALKGYFGSISVVAEPTQMLRYGNAVRWRP